MTDTISKEHRSWNMSRIKGKNTKPEVTVRSLLHKMGYRFRLNRKDLPGKPDIVLPKYNTVIFIHGCFWHQHKNCSRSNIPKTNDKYWIPKLEKNILRDKQVIKNLRKLNWNVFVLWECEIKNIKKIKREINRILND